MFRYSIDYRRRDSATRTYHIVVTAKDAEDARRAAAIRDPEFSSTTRTPRRLGAIIDRCRICGGELDQDFTFLTDGGAACWRCREKADLPEDQEWVAHIDGGRFGDIEVDIV